MCSVVMCEVPIMSPHEHLLQWAREQGAKLHPSVTISELPGFGLSVTAIGPIPTTEAVFELPSSLLIDPYTSIQDPCIRHAANSIHVATGRRCPAALAIVLKLSLERSRGSDSLYFPYINSLPLHGQGLMHLSPEDAHFPALSILLEGTGICASVLVDQLTHLRNGVSRTAKFVNQHWCTENSLAWAFAMYSSRAMLVPLPIGAFGKILKVPAMFPIADICNHACTSASRFECGKGPSRPAQPIPYLHLLDLADIPLLDIFENSGDSTASVVPLPDGLAPPGSSEVPKHPFPISISLYSGRAVKEGQQIFINYGGKSHEDFVKFYGFVDQENPCMSIYMEPFAPASDTKLVLCPSFGHSAQKYIVVTTDPPEFLLEALHGDPAPLHALRAPLPVEGAVEGLPQHVVLLIQQYRTTLLMLLRQLWDVADPGWEER